MEEVGQVNLKEYDFNLLFWQIAYFIDGSEQIENYKIPERIGKWVAYKSTYEGPIAGSITEPLDIVSS